MLSSLLHGGASTPLQSTLTGLLMEVNRPKPSVQEYFRAIRDQQVTTDYHLDRLAAGMTPAKKRKTHNHVLYKICGDFLEYDSVLMCDNDYISYTMLLHLWDIIYTITV